MTLSKSLNSVAPDWQWHCVKMTYNSNSETELGYVMETGEQISPDWAIFVQTIDATETINIGLLYSENSNGGDADGFVAGASIATAGWVYPSWTVSQGTNAAYISAKTMGAYFQKGQDGANTAENNAVPIYMPHTCDGSQKTMSYTCSAGSDTFVGFFYFKTRILPDLTNFLSV